MNFKNYRDFPTPRLTHETTYREGALKFLAKIKAVYPDKFNLQEICFDNPRLFQKLRSWVSIFSTQTVPEFVCFLQSLDCLVRIKDPGDSEWKWTFYFNPKLKIPEEFVQEAFVDLL